MFPLTNTDILAPLIVGFVLEQVEMDSLVSYFRSTVTKFQQQGMSEAEIASKLFTLLKSKEVKVMTLESTEVYKEPAEKDETVSTWLKAKNTPSARDHFFIRNMFIYIPVGYLANGRFQILATERVPEEFIPPADPWPKHPVPITLKNLGDFRVEYMYPEDGKTKTGVLMENQISERPTMFYLNTPYMFSFRNGRTVKSTS